MLKGQARPGLVVSRRPERAQKKPAVANGLHHFIPEALAVYKRGRWCIVAKLVTVDEEVVLAVCHRHQRGVDTTISIPVVGLQYSEQRDARWLYFRRDFMRRTYRLPIAEVTKVGYLGPGAGAEWYIPIAKMEEVRWPNWEYVEKVVRLGNEEDPTITSPSAKMTSFQIPLFGEVANG